MMPTHSTISPPADSIARRSPAWSWSCVTCSSREPKDAVMSSDNDEFGHPKMTSGPSIPIHGPQERKPFGAGTTPGRDAPGAGTTSRDDLNAFAHLFRSPYGGSSQSTDPTSSFAPSISLPTGGGALR